MSTLLLVRHGLTAMTGPVLAGRTPGVHLDERGEKQAETTAERIAALPLAAVVSSPLDRCLDTAGYVQRAQADAGRDLDVQIERRLIECDYGEWTGRPLKELARDPIWKLVQTQPSAARFPSGESMTEISARAVAAVREWNARLPEDAIWVACSHADVIKVILADALGLHLDQYQRIVVDPCSVSVVRYTAARPYVLRSNDVGSDLAAFAPPKKRRRTRRDDAAIGGGAGGPAASGTTPGP